ncbi:MAG TPA: family 16 glycoside hydrolase, partial [Gemmataceae bacterium]|nr:family 16 glycoside hydrolase [Gemmataceae bacterium]
CLVSKQHYKDFDLQFRVRRKDGLGRTAVYFRSRVEDARLLTVVGPYCEIGPRSVVPRPGSLLIEPLAASVPVAAPEEVSKEYKDAAFNDFHIRCVGKRVTIRVNGVVAVDQDAPDVPDEGVIAWRLNAWRPPEEVTFKDVVFDDLVASPAGKNPPETKADGRKGSEPEKPNEAARPRSDPVRETLNASVRLYDDTMKDLDDKLRKKLDQEKDKAQKKGDKKAVDLINEERLAFDKYAVVPRLSDQLAEKQYRQGRDKARDEVRKAYEAAVRRYTQAKNEKKADDTEKEYQTFLINHLTDPFQKGTVWKGSQTTTVRGTATAETVDVKLTVLERDATTFRAQVEVGAVARTVKGTIDGAGKVTVRKEDGTAAKGTTGETHAGQLDRAAVVLRAEVPRPDKKVEDCVTTLRLELK